MRVQVIALFNVFSWHLKLNLNDARNKSGAR